MSKVFTHKYFDKKTSEWDILDFLNECEEEQFGLKIHQCITSLEKIVSFKQSSKGVREGTLLQTDISRRRNHKWEHK
ncbi:hypothetical protein Glove_499g18 [Diversispora epigaea]|uniref:Uncharacterized protein n=1 Tax=Diversispora epigaea TaxID=1348612 RepID=A0A397GN22_9GLOM|nr:hypothetical protein Glove_499g18 [Diversispora epigaea]